MEHWQRLILLVDSSTTYLFYMAMLLKRLGYEVQTTTAAEEALALTEAMSPSLIMIDTQFPVMSGVDLLKAFRRDTRFTSIPVIVHSSENDPAIERTCTIIGCAAYFRKPAEPNALYRTIQQSIEKSPRQHIRISTSLKVDILNGMMSNNGRRTEDVANLSESGLYVRTTNPSPVNSVVPLKIHFPNRMVRVTAEVHSRSMINVGRHHEPGMGMQFISMSDADQLFVRDYIKERITAGIVFE